jgi:hypothetical protein
MVQKVLSSGSMEHVSVTPVATYFAALDAQNTHLTAPTLTRAIRAAIRAGGRPLEGSEPR